jgi:hypothetical protein
MRYSPVAAFIVVACAMSSSSEVGGLAASSPAADIMSVFQ